MNKTKLLLIRILIIVFFIIIIFIFFSSRSYTRALKKAGLSVNGIHIIDEGIPENTYQEYKVIQTTSKDGEWALVRLVKNNFGFWKIESCDYTKEVMPAFIATGWINKATAKRFHYAENARFEHEWHYAYCGNNAVKDIEFLEGQIPSNVTVNIEQAGEKYWIHIISFADPEVINKFDVMTILQENGCIK